MLLLPLLSLSALWGFVLNLTVGDGAALLRAETLYNTIGVTSTDLGLQLQDERARSAVAISSRVIPSDLAAQRTRTDASVKRFRQAALGEDAAEAVSDEMRVPLNALLDQLDRLPQIRTAIDEGTSDRLTALTDYNEILDQVFRVYDQLSAVPDLSIFQQAAAMQAMGNAYEYIARENALISGALIDRRLTPGERIAFTEYVSNRRLLHARGLSALDAELRRPYENVLYSSTFKQFADLERQIITETDAANGRLDADAERWRAAAQSVSVSLDRLGASSSAILTDRATSIATGILVRIAIAGGVGLIAVVASIIISVRFGRRLARELAGLRRTAMDLANVHLPSVVERLRRAEPVDIEAEAPPIKATGSIEIRDVAQAFASVQRTAIQAAVGQAELRRGVSQVFVNLARRKQTLLHKQFTLLDGMQRRTEDPDTLEDLFRLDHLTTRMRRHAEGLIILSGAVPGRAWRRPVPVIDVLRAAVSEVEDYTRVTVLPAPAAAVIGSAVADVTHLLAELIENATLFSPPGSTVTVRGDTVANGFAVEVEDRGLGLHPEEYAAINARLAEPPEFDLADSDRLGLFVVGRLAARHGIRVMLRASPYGGTTAIVLLPRTLVADLDNPVAGPAAIAAGPGPAQGPGPHGGPSTIAATALPQRTDRGGPQRTDRGGAGQPRRAERPRRTERADRPRRAERPAVRRAADPDARRPRPAGDGGEEILTPSNSDLFTPRPAQRPPAPAAPPAERSPFTPLRPPGTPGPLAAPTTAEALDFTDATDATDSADSADSAALEGAVGTAHASDDGDRRPENGSPPPPLPSRRGGVALTVVNGTPEPEPEEPAEAGTDDEDAAREPHGPVRSAPAAGAHAGLPKRVRQAHMAPQLRKTPHDRPDAGERADVPGSAHVSGSAASPGRADASDGADGEREGERTGGEARADHKVEYSEPPEHTGSEGSGGPSAERSPDEVRALFSAFQQGVRRGREEASDYVHHTTGDKRDE
ncbi:signal transduction histidine kinase [Thermocatellispora tengchongensis]|uniref:histidine kinase n=1 Tax=Thermocatellispora tengchongensis TaxID=1073253 RepID=A0A840P0V0_9ACTN|nr:sensor histidine kinase [Thermocatellispora tengchongensis]MBB5130887.1 signal transduction histidine kinase [Thermocatellispora tengchongensis]